MPKAASTHPKISKSALARLLGCAEDDLLSREDAAKEIGRSEGTLANIAKFGPPFYCSTAGPTGGETWYPKAEILAYADHLSSTIKSSWRGRKGRQEWSHLLDDANRLSVHAVVSMIEEWKDSELYRRAQAILHDPNPLAGRAAYEEECRLFGAAEKDGRLSAFAEIAEAEDSAAHRKAIFQSLDDQTNAVEKHLLALTASRGLSVSPEHPSFFVLSAMFERAWGDVLEAETRWRNFDYSGMPKHLPRTISDVSISVSLKDRSN